MVAALTRTGKGVGSRRSLIRDGGLRRRGGQKDTGGGRGRGVEGFGGRDFAWRRKSKREGVLGGFVPRERERVNWGWGGGVRHGRREERGVVSLDGACACVVVSGVTAVAASHAVAAVLAALDKGLREKGLACGLGSG
jgi:hypothetical protein